MSKSKTTSEWREIYDKKGSNYPEWLKGLIEKEKGSLDTWLDEERRQGNSSEEGVYLGDGIYM